MRNAPDEQIHITASTFLDLNPDGNDTWTVFDITNSQEKAPELLEHPGLVTIQSKPFELKTLHSNNNLTKAIGVLIDLDNVHQDTVFSDALEALYTQGLLHGLDICTIMQQVLSEAYKKFDGVELLKAVRLPLKHMIASSEEIKILRKHFPEKQFGSHYVKCPVCWDCYIALEQ
jgi:hypothetical protein